MPLLSFVLIAFILSPQMLEQRGGQERVESSGGTVNVILATGDTLVAVTDSMLTWNNPERHDPTGTKLFKIDDRTLCTMAGLYSQSGPDGLHSLEVLVPQIMSDFVEYERKTGAVRSPFAHKVDSMLTFFEHRLTTNLQALVSSDPRIDITKVLPLELTVAGYEVNNRLEVADITLAPKATPYGTEFVSVERPHGPFTPICELSAGTQRALTHRAEGGREIEPAIRVIGESLFCEIAGLADEAEQRLDWPNNFPKTPTLSNYSQAKAAGRTLTLDEMRDLAIFLDRETEAAERRSGMQRVGGHPQIAALSVGKMLEQPDSESIPPGVGDDLSANHAVGTRITCGNPGVEIIHCAHGCKAQVQVDATNCYQVLDGILFHDSHFNDGELSYFGQDSLDFPESNVVSGTILRLGTNVDIGQTKVIRLVCNFPWKKVYRGVDELKFPCAPNPAK